GGDCVQIALVDPVRDPEDRPDRNTGLRGIDNFENYMRLLGPPPSQPANADVRRGEQLFQSARCHVCHTPSLPTGPSPVQALSLKRFFPYSDFLLHDIGTGDGIVQGNAGPEEIRTPPLWGAYFRAPFLHDGRAATLREAIERHRAEAENSRRLFEAFSEAEKAALLSFLESL
ncbi:MAG: thiol oxidoreductase, partial [Acidobacteria bacterium]|nr:thiol oxidoreductase [Acidobacteriota bacterium]